MITFAKVILEKRIVVLNTQTQIPKEVERGSRKEDREGRKPGDI